VLGWRKFAARAVVGAAAAVGAVAAAGGPAAASTTGSYVLAATDPGGNYAPTFTGNGEIGVRVPPVGQGYAGGAVPAQSELAGFYAQPSGEVQQRANIPTWSTLTFSDGGQPFSLSSGSTSGWQQSLDLHTGIVRTTARWTAPNGQVTDLTYQVFTDRARTHVGLVQLQLTPRWSGSASVTDMIDGTPATLTTLAGKGADTSAHTAWVTAQTEGTSLKATIASQLGISGNVVAQTAALSSSDPQTTGEQLTFPVRAGQTYTFTKYVGIDSSLEANDPTKAAKTDAADAALAGFASLQSEDSAAWAALWNGRIDIEGNDPLATAVNASEFYLWSTTRAGVNWSISPAGLSSNGYNGHIFWDAETWMYPSLLAQHPDLAAGINAYRDRSYGYDRLRAAETHAAETGYQGARYPWESALDGTEQIPPPVSVNSEGLYEQHITADIALAQWQYYLATGDKKWLANQGWPVLSQAARFWASRVMFGSDGRYHINGVTGPDEENPDVNDEAYTNVAAATTLRDAVQAAQVLGITPPSDWSRKASNMTVLTDPVLDIHPEFTGYGGQMVKQADVTLLQYPWRWSMPASMAQNDIDYYVPRTDPGGPSMSDSVNEIDTSALGSPGCASYVYTERSYEPFIRDVFDQFSETRTGGAFTFMTGIGGFMQEFLYGYSGFRWGSAGVRLDPSLTSQIGGIVLHNVSWQGRRFTISIGQTNTTVTLSSGSPLPVTTPSGTSTVTTGGTLTVPTRRPDLTPTNDVVRCQAASATSSQPGAPPLAAVDGSPATDWQPAAVPATLTSPVQGAPQTVRTATVVWGEQWPPPPGPNMPPPPGPVTVLRPSKYKVLVSADAKSWRTVATVNSVTGTTDVLRFPATPASFVRLEVDSSGTPTPPMLEELNVTG
jgi:trehalose/maltose hydrolase-like predicted phosphorylase